MKLVLTEINSHLSKKHTFGPNLRIWAVSIYIEPKKNLTQLYLKNIKLLYK